VAAGPPVTDKSPFDLSPNHVASAPANDKTTNILSPSNSKTPANQAPPTKIDDKTPAFCRQKKCFTKTPDTT
jgi:hypothetical protein